MDRCSADEIALIDATVESIGARIALLQARRANDTEIIKAMEKRWHLLRRKVELLSGEKADD